MEKVIIGEPNLKAETYNETNESSNIIDVNATVIENDLPNATEDNVIETEIPNMEIEAESIKNEIKESDSLKEKEEESIDSIFIKTATPYNIAFNVKDGKDIATLVFLCRDKDDKLIVIDRNIIVSKEEKELLSLIPFAENDDCDFVSEKITNHMIITYLDNYITDMNFSVSADFAKETDPVVTLNAKKVDTKEEYVIRMSAETFVCMAFVDSYIFEGIDNEHDLAIASVAGSRDDKPIVDFFLVDKIESIVSMAPACIDEEPMGLIDKIKNKFKKKPTYDTTIGMVLKVSKFVSSEEKEVVSILTPFDIGVTFDNDKFRGNTIASIEKDYYGDSDQYVSTLMINEITLGGVDKRYMIIRGKTKDKRVRLFLFDSSLQKELQDMINEY